MSDGSIKIDTKIDSSGLKTSLSSMEKNVNSFVGNVKNSFATMRDVMQGPIAGAKMLADGIKKIGDATVGSAAKIEDMTAAFTPLTGSAENAKKMITALNKEAASTPFELEGIGKVAKQLLPVLGNDVKAVTSTFRMLGDTAGGNIEKLDSITRGYVKVLNTGKVSMEALNMISDAGVPIQSQLAKYMGLSVQEMMDLSSQGKITADVLTATFKDMTKEGGLFYNGMALASETLSGKISTMYDNFAQAGAAIGTIFLPMVKDIVTTVGNIAGEFAKWATENNNLLKTITLLAAGLASGAIAFGVFTVAVNISSIITAVSSAMGGLAIAVKAVTVALAANPIVAIATVLSTVLVPTILIIIDKIGGWKIALLELQRIGLIVVRAMLDAFSALANIYVSVLNGLITAYNKVVSIVGGKPIKLFEKVDIATATGLNAKIDEVTEAIRRQREEMARLAIQADKTSAAQENVATPTVSAVEAPQNTAVTGLFGDAFKVELGKFKLKKSDISGDFGSSFKMAGKVVSEDFIKNLIKGISENTVKVTSQVKSVVKNIAGAFQSSVKVASGIFSALSSVIQINPGKLIKSLGEAVKTIEKFFTSTLGSLPYYADAALNMITSLVNGLISNLPAIKETATNVVKYLATQLSERGPMIAYGVIQILTALALAIIDNLPVIVKSALRIGMSILTGMLNAMPEIIAGISSALPEIVKEIVKVVPQIIVALIKAFPSIIVALAKVLPEITLLFAALPTQIAIEIIKELPSVISGIWTAIVSFFTQGLPAAYKSFVDVGGNIIKGFIEGIISAGANIWNAIVGTFNNMVNAVKNFFGIHSPSTLFADFGINIIKGLINGIISAGAGLWSSVSSVFTGLVSNINGVFSTIGMSFSFVVTAIKTSFTWSNMSSTFNTFKANVSSVFMFLGNMLQSVFSWSGISKIMQTLATNISSAFSGIYSGVKSIWDGLATIMKAPFNTVISAINTMIRAMNTISVKIPDWVPGIGGRGFGINIGEIGMLATGTNNFKGSAAFINDQNAGVKGAELVTLPNGSKVATATATEGLLNQGVMSIMQKLSGMLAPSMDSVGMDRTITLINKNDNRFYADGRQLAQVMIENIDKVAIN